MSTASAPAPTSAPAAAKKPAPPRDSFRELVETVVFVVALVLMLKLFVVEAFVIPTGSMAETLFGYQKLATCPECGFAFPVNSSNEVDPADGKKVQRVLGAGCPNCRHKFEWRPDDSPANRSGDRVLVDKTVYALGAGPDRGDVVVFKFPVDPQVKYTAQNYIKRLWGFGGETIAISRGDLYATRTLTYPATELDGRGTPKYPRPDDPTHLWEGPEAEYLSKTTPKLKAAGPDFTYHNADAAYDAFVTARKNGFPAGGFDLIRKSDDQMLAMRRIVYDNDFQSRTLAKAGVPPRWLADAGWTPDDPVTPRAFAHTGPDRAWVRYRHLVPRNRDEWESPETIKPSVVTNYMGYNSGSEEFAGDFRLRKDKSWVGDLIAECHADVTAAGAEVVLELSKGPHRYQAVFGGGKVTLVRTGPGKETKELASAACEFAGPGAYDLRFANVDCRLRVAVNGKRIEFGAAADYPPDPLPETFVENLDSDSDGWTLENDVAAPASVGATGAVRVSKLVLWRDTYFTHSESPKGHGGAGSVDTYYVQPNHYLCLGDNSAQSSDSRMWGTVPDRLMLGKAVFVFAPFVGDGWVPRFDRVGFIR